MSTVVSNPFALLLNPAAVFAQLERSEPLSQLRSRVCRPLDKPMLGGASNLDMDGEGEDMVGGDDDYLSFGSSTLLGN